METFRQDIRYAIRMIARNPRFAVVTLAVLAIGIGATTAIFSVASVALFRPLPFPDSSSIARIWDFQPEFGQTPLSYREFTDVRDRNDVFSSVAAMQGGQANLTGTGDPVKLYQARVSVDFFNVMKWAPRMGRTFLPEEDRLGGNNVAMLSEKLWKQRFGGSRDIIGQSIQLDGASYTVVGVLGNDSPFLDIFDVWRPLAADPKAILPRDLHFLTVVGRLKPEVTMRQAGANLETLAAARQKQYSTDHGLQAVSLQSSLFGDSRPMMLAFLIAVAFLLLIAWANVANLQLVRAGGRQREIAVRIAIGAGRGRLVRQLFTESLVLSLAGALLGILLAYATVPLLVGFSPDSISWVKTAKIDPAVLLFALCISVITGAIFGLLPALQASKPDLVESLKEGSKSTSGSANILRGALVVSEIALALILLVGAGLTMRSFFRLTNVHSGFEPENVLTMKVPLATGKYKEDRQQAEFYHDLLERVASLPDTKAAGLVNSLPLSGEGIDGDVGVRGYVPASPADAPHSEKYLISPDYFRVMGIPLLKGRFFNSGDVPGAPPVAIINEAMARQFWPDSDPIGKEIQFHWINADWQRVVGVVGDVKNVSLDQPVPLETYLPYSQAIDPSVEPYGLTLIVKTKGDPLAAVPMVRGQVLDLDRDQPVSDVNSLSKVLSNSVSQPKSITFILGFFAGIALLLAAVGIYGVISYWVSHRTKEIGIRMALGADRASVLGMVAGQAAKIILAGIGIGLIGAFALTRLMSTLLFGVAPTDPLTFSLILAMLVIIGLLASYIPALKATRIDPVTAIRYE